MSSTQLPPSNQGVLLAISAYLMWGFAPIYFKALADVAPLEILAHRIIWSFVLLGIVIHFGQGWSRFRQTIAHKKSVIYLLTTSLVIAANWLIFIWAVNSEHMLEASLGYYINPIINVILGMLFLGERLRKWQWLAIILAFTGVFTQLVTFGSIPYVAFSLALTFGCYGLLRKKVLLDSQTGLFFETLVLFPIALIYLLSVSSPTSEISTNPLSLNLLLLAAGAVTTAPLLCFTAAATRLKLSTLGFFQYIGPSLMFILAVTVYNEPLSSDKIITFGFIWTALLIFSLDGIKYHRSKSNIFD